MTSNKPVWWISWKGDIRHQVEKPRRRGWAACIAPEDVPSNYDPEVDYWLHLVVSPLGTPHYVQLAYKDDGHEKRWEPIGVLSMDEAMDLTMESRETYGVGHDERGESSKLERWK